MNFRFKKLFSISPLKIGLLITFSVVLLYFLNFSFLRFMELKSLDLRMVSRGKAFRAVKSLLLQSTKRA